MATPCSNYRLTRASRISARADLYPSPKLVGPIMELKSNTTQNTETGTLKKPMDKLNTGSTIHTSTVPKGPHPKLGMTGGRKPAANASVTSASAPKVAIGNAKALGPPAGVNKYTYAERRTAAQTLRSHTRSTAATPSPEWLKKVEWARMVLPNYGQMVLPKRQRSLELPGPSAKRSKIHPLVSFAEITKNRVLLGLIDRGNPEGRIPRNKWKAVESHLSLICLRMVREKPGTSPCCMDAGWYKGSVQVVACV